MSTAYAPGPAAESDRTRQLLTNITNSLLDLFDTKQSFFISNDSMRVLIRGLSNQLEAAVEEDKEAALFAQWDKTMPQAKQTLIRIASDYPLALSDGRQIPVMSEDKSARFLRLCPDAPEY